MIDPIFTARLELAVPTPEDALAILEIAGNRRTVEHNPSDLLADLHEAQDLVERWTRHWRDRTLGYWCVREVGRPRVVGYCGLKTATVKGLSVLNLIYRFAPDVWGRGYVSGGQLHVARLPPRSTDAAVTVRRRQRCQRVG